MERHKFVQLTLHSFLFITMLPGYIAWLYSMIMIFSNRPDETASADIFLLPIVVWMMGCYFYAFDRVTNVSRHFFKLHFLVMLFLVGGFVYVYFSYLIKTIKS